MTGITGWGSVELANEWPVLQVEVVWNALYSDWDETLDELETMLEAHTFARDAKSANTWITNQVTLYYSNNRIC